MQESIFWSDEEDVISHQYAYFSIKGVQYIIDFSSDPDLIANFTELDSRICEIVAGHHSYTVKFAVREYYEDHHNNKYLFDAPEDHNFGRKDIQQLKEFLEKFLYEHFKQYQVECYCFIAERDSLNRMYRKMCKRRHLLLADFEPIYGLGNEQNCFIIKTPLYKER
ncbi:hypothetical protein [Gallibacterium anatis]|uniref:hypothetical protein n=1 Tax=Gallibacterium anatis TaxID=750 RepID=UPI0008025B79|nr:hypothetical protein [Gallibacterium anatis]